MTTLIFIWYIITSPVDRYICTIWTSQPPTSEQLHEACPEAITIYDALHVYSIEKGEHVCDAEAEALKNLLEMCQIEGPLDAYRIIVVEPNYQSVICAVVTETDAYPTAETVTDQCPGYRPGMEITYAGSRADPEPAPVCLEAPVTQGGALTQTPASPALLATSQRYTWLAGRLLWHGLAQPMCDDGLSGLDMQTGAAIPCGMDGAIGKVIEWQNRYDDAIWQTAQNVGVPAVMLKAIFGVESQFWPLWEPASETAEISGMQITLDGLDIPLRYDPDLAGQICSITMDASRCAVSNYPGLTADEQLTMRYVLRALLAPCSNCLPFQAADKVSTDMIFYARILRAWRCYAAETTGATGDTSWYYAAAAYHAGGTCIVNGSICDDGQSYLTKLEGTK